MRFPKVRELKEAVTAIIQGPYTHPFPKQPTPVPETLRAAPKYDEEFCIGCGACAEVCPARAIRIEDHSNGEGFIRTLTCHYGNCIFCGECQLNCTTEKGIVLTREYELSYFEETEAKHQIEHELVICEVCGLVVAPLKQLQYLYKKLGTLSYSNPTVYITHTKDLGFVSDIPPRDDRPIERSDLLRLTCPHCRRDVLLKEQWGK